MREDTSEMHMSEAVRIERLVIEYSVYYALQRPETRLESPPPLLVAAHGYGQSCKGFIRNFESLHKRNVLVVAPQGPSQMYWVERGEDGRAQQTGKVGFSWMTRYMRQNTIDDLMKYMARLMENLRTKERFDERNIFSLGFSQGSALAFRFGAYGIVRPAGVIACGGDLPPDVTERLDEIDRFPVLIVHGKDDTSMSFEKAREGEEKLRAHAFEVETIYFDGGHELEEAQVREIVEWMERIVERTATTKGT